MSAFRDAVQATIYAARDAYLDRIAELDEQGAVTQADLDDTGEGAAVLAMPEMQRIKEALDRMSLIAGLATKANSQRDVLERFGLTDAEIEWVFS